MLENEMEINKLEDEELELQKQVKKLTEQNKQLIEEDKLTYEQWLETEEAEQLVNAYAKAMNIDIKEEI